MTTPAPLIPITACDFAGENAPAVNARELHSFLGVRSNFRDWIKNRINDFEFVENQDFAIFAKNLSKGRPPVASPDMTCATSGDRTISTTSAFMTGRNR